MSELQNRLHRLTLKLDYMGMRCEQAVIDAVTALRKGDTESADSVNKEDAFIDREEVAIEQECIRLLALYQPAAVDLRTICTYIKVNSDLERIADLAASIARQTKHSVSAGLVFEQYTDFDLLVTETLEIVGKTMRMITASEISTAISVIDDDDKIDRGYAGMVHNLLHSGKPVGPTMTLINLAKALERIGDLCTNIAEDIIFLRTGDIIRHQSRAQIQVDLAPAVKEDKQTKTAIKLD